MDLWVVWIIVAVAFAVGEIVSLGFFLAPFAGGALLAAAADAAGAPDVASVAVFLVASALLFGIVNAFIGTILRILTFPLTLLTLGLFSILVNAFLLQITDAISDHFTIDEFWWTAIWGAIIMAMVLVVLNMILGALAPRRTATPS